MVRLFWAKFLVLQSLNFKVSKVGKLFATCMKGAFYDFAVTSPRFNQSGDCEKHSVSTI